MVRLSERLKPFLKGRCIPALFLFLLAIVISFFNLRDFLSLVISKVPIPSSDVALYWYLAKKMQIDGVFLPSLKGVFFSPIYAFLFFIFSKIGNSITVASIFSSICFVLSSLLLFELVLKIFDDYKVAFLSSFLFILYKPVEFYAVLPIKTSFFIFILIFFLFCLAKAFRDEITICYFFSGILFVIGYGTEGLFLPIALLVIGYSLLRFKIKVKDVMLFFIGLFICISPFSIRNLVVNGEVYPFSRISGIHFYIGNSLGSNGFYRTVKGIRSNAFGHYYDARIVAEHIERKKLTDSDVNRFWIRKAFKSIKQRPMMHLLLFLKKLLIVVNEFEYPNNFDIYVLEKNIRFLNINPFNFSFLFALAAGGIVMYLLRREFNEILLVAFAFPFILSLFFIASRYRIIWVLFLMPFASYFLIKAIQSELVKRSVVIALIAFFVSKMQILTLSEKKVIDNGFNVRVQHAKELYKIEKSMSKSRRRNMLLEAKIFYNVGMWEIGDFIRRQAYKMK